MKYLTIYDLAVHCGYKEGEPWPDDLPIMGGCADCEASLGAFNAYPSTTGYLLCRDCLDGRGFLTWTHYDLHCSGGRCYDRVEAPAPMWWDERIYSFVGMGSSGMPFWSMRLMQECDLRSDSEVVPDLDPLYMGR